MPEFNNILKILQSCRENREQELYVYLQVMPLCVVSGTQLGVSLSVSHMELITLIKVTLTRKK